MLALSSAISGKRLAAPLLGVMLLVGCSGSSPDAEEPERAPSLTGIATYDTTLSTGDVSGKGAAGPLRTAKNSTGTNRFSISLTSLTAPYALKMTAGTQSGGLAELYTVATQPGVANITPLSTLLMAELLGQEPAAIYAGFGASGTVRMDLITDANLQAAQARLTTYLEDVLGVDVKSGTASFISASFNAVAGDPMFDTIMALDAKLAADGITVADLAEQLAIAARFCIVEKIQVTIGGQAQDFCTAAKSATPREDDETILDYVFRNAANDVLTLAIQVDTVLHAQLVTAGGTEYSCDGAACSAIALGAPAADLSRSIAFSGTVLVGASKSAVITGTLLGPVPGVALPILPCDNNKFFTILPDHSVVAECVDAFDPLGLGGTLNFLRGAVPSRAYYEFTNSGTADPTRPRVEVTTDANDSLISAHFYRVDPDTFFTTVQFVCELAACNGVTLGPVTVNTDLGPETPVLIRTITFDNTILAELNEDGSSTGETATLIGSFVTVYFTDPFAPTLFPPLADCVSGGDTVAVEVESGPFNFCSSAGAREVFDLEDGGVQLRMTEDNFFSPIDVQVHDGAVTQILYQSPASQTFYCSGNCAGVTVSGPDEFGIRRLTFDGTVLHEQQHYPLPGTRTATLTSGELVFPPPP